MKRSRHIIETTRTLRSASRSAAASATPTSEPVATITVSGAPAQSRAT